MEIIKKILFNKYLILILRVIIGFVFIYASIYKITDPESFAKNIENYRIIPTYLVNLIAIILPWLELLLGLFILSGFFTRASAFLAATLMAAFTLLVFSAIIRNINTDCGCFSASGAESPIGWKKFFENIGLLLISIILYLSPDLNFTIEKYFKNKS